MKPVHRIFRKQVSTRRLIAMIAACGVLTTGAVHAKLPPAPPVPPEQKEALAAKAAAQAAAEQEALARAQDRVSERYRREMIQQGKTPPEPVPTPQTAQANLPKTVTEPPRSAGPHGGTKQSAEAHSGSAK
jgi:hypothetical protein